MVNRYMLFVPLIILGSYSLLAMEKEKQKKEDPVLKRLRDLEEQEKGAPSRKLPRSKRVRGKVDRFAREVAQHSQRNRERLRKTQEEIETEADLAADGIERGKLEQQAALFAGVRAERDDAHGVDADDDYDCRQYNPGEGDDD